MAAAITSTLFGSAIKSVFDSWTALQLAVSHGFGGADSHAKADWLVFATETWFAENQNIESYELEEFLAEILSNEFDLLIDDTSLPEVASKICLYYRLCAEGSESVVLQRMKDQPKAAIDRCQEAQQQADVLSVNESEMTSLSTNGPQTTSLSNTTANETQSCGDMEVEEEDGWEVVKRGKKR